MVESWHGFCVLFLSLLRREHSDGLQVIFGDYSDIVENDIHTVQRFQDVSRFLYPGGWQVCVRKTSSGLAKFGLFS